MAQKITLEVMAYFKSMLTLIGAMILFQMFTMALADCENSGDKHQTTSAVSAADKKLIIKKHNDCRRVVAEGIAMGKDGFLPLATDMVDLKWNDDLARAAQRLADSCVYGHTDENIKPFKSVGQNLFMTIASTPLTSCVFDKAVLAWYNEIKSYTRDQREPFKSILGTGHFTQMVWSTTTHVGCGCRNFKQANDKKNPYRQIIACNYGPAGNRLNGEMYKIK